MTVLSDVGLRQIWPGSPHIGPASIDLHIGGEVRWWPEWIVRDPRLDQTGCWRNLDVSVPHNGWLLRPGVRYIATTLERIKIPDDCAGQLSARSSWGRDGLAVICGPAGWCDPGYVGNPTLELSVVGSHLVLWPGAGCLQLIVHRLETPCSQPYGHPDRKSKYQDDREPTPSKMHLETVR